MSDDTGDDLCDLCQSSEVNVDRTTYCGKTIGIECGCEEANPEGTCSDKDCKDCDDNDDWDEFTKKYTLVKNHLDDNASGDGFMFETYGPEVEFVKDTPEERIWTLVDGGHHGIIVAGWHYVNRLGYFITEQPRESDEESYRN